MRNLLIAAGAAAMFMACGGTNNGSADGIVDNTKDYDMYTLGTPNTIYVDEQAPMDTLSYAAGLYFGLGLNLQSKSAELDMEIFRKHFDEILFAPNLDERLVYESKKYVRKFSNERYSNYSTIKRLNDISKTSKQDLPILYDEKYTREDVSRHFAVLMAGQMRQSYMPLNYYWMMQSFEKSLLFEDIMDADKCMDLKVGDAAMLMRKYNMQGLPNAMLENSRKWLADVATKEGVVMDICGGDTLYYKIHKAGNDRHPANNRDSVIFCYTLRNLNGALIESSQDIVRDAEVAIAEINADTALTDSERLEALANVERFLNPGSTLEGVKLKGVIQAMKYIGEGGVITVWMPSTLAYGKMLMDPILPNMAVAMTVSLSKVIPVTEQVLIKQPKRNEPMLRAGDATTPQAALPPKGTTPVKPLKPVKFSEYKTN